MKLILDNNQEIPLENIKVIEVNKNQKVVFTIDAVANMEGLIAIREELEKFFAPAKILVLTKDVKMDVIETK